MKRTFPLQKKGEELRDWAMNMIRKNGGVTDTCLIGSCKNYQYIYIYYVYITYKYVAHEK